MYALSAQKILRIWETGLQRHSIDRALIILAEALPEISWNGLHLLSIGQRDRYLLAVREATFGGELAAIIRCPACQGQLEFQCTTTDISVSSDEQPGDQVYQMSFDEYMLAFRVPNSFDLLAITHSDSTVVARQLLIERCVLQASHQNVAITPATLPEAVTVALAGQMAQYDPQAEVIVDLNCPECGHCWSELFDIGAFIWIEIDVCARRLLRAVHMLARAYGWHEADILALSAARRTFYIEMVT